MKHTKIMFMQIYTCTVAICLGLSVYLGINEKARQDNVVIISVVLGFVFFAILFVGAVGIIGALLSQISNSKREFALRLATGATTARVIKSFLVRWLVHIAMLPVALGLGTVSAILVLLGQPISSAMGFQMIINFGLVAYSFVLIMVFCVAIAIYPAYKAANTHILQTLAA